MLTEAPAESEDEWMNLEFYKLAEQPFGVTPDPRYLPPGYT